MKWKQKCYTGGSESKGSYECFGGDLLVLSNAWRLCISSRGKNGDEPYRLEMSISQSAAVLGPVVNLCVSQKDVVLSLVMVWMYEFRL